LLRGSLFYSSSFDGTTDRAYNISAPGTAYVGSTASEMAHLFFNTLGNLALLIPVAILPNPALA